VDILHNMAVGFGVALTPMNLLFCFLGSLVEPWSVFCRAWVPSAR